MAIVRIKKFTKSGLVNIPSYKDSNTYFTVDLQADGGGSRKKVPLSEEEIEEFSEALGVDKKELSNQNSAFWRDYFFLMKGGITELDDTISENKLALRVLSIDSRVISTEADRVKKPKAEYIIERETEIVEKKVKRRSVLVDAYSKYGQMSAADFINVLLVYGKNPKDLTDSKIKQLVGDELDNNPEKFLSIIEDKHFNDKVFINALIQEQIIKKSGSGYTYDGEMIAHDLSSLIIFMKTPKNENLVVALKKALNQKLGNKKVEV